MSTIWVSGATGFVGTRLVEQLVEAGYDVRGLAHRRELPESSTRHGISLIRGDVLKPATLPSTMEGCDAAIHLVGVIFERRGGSFYQVHFLGAVNVVEAALAAGVRRFLLMSALGVHPEAASQYHRTKWMAEKHLSASGLDHTIMRPSVIFGAGDSFVNMLARMTKMAPFVPVVGPGSGHLQPIWIDDVAACFVRALAKPTTVGKTYELGGPKRYTFNELLETVAQLVGRRSRRLHVPLPLARALATAMELLLPKPPLTRDQLTMLGEHNVCDISTMVSDLDVHPAALEDVFPGYYGK